MLRYNFRHLAEELYHTIRNPKRDDRYELAFAWHRFWSDVTYPFRIVKYGLQNLWAYKGIIWNDRDWDHSFFLDLLEKKFTRMAYLFENYSHHVGADRSAQQLRVAAELCRRIREDNYSEYDSKKHDEKWGELHSLTIPVPGARASLWRPQRLHVTNDAEREAERREFMVFMNHAEQSKKNDLEYLCRLINKYLFTWWD